MVFHHQLEDVAAFAQSHPDAQLVLNHVGGSCGVGPWNVYVNLGGLLNSFFCGISFRDGRQPDVRRTPECSRTLD